MDVKQLKKLIENMSDETVVKFWDSENSTPLEIDYVIDERDTVGGFPVSAIPEMKEGFKNYNFGIILSHSYDKEAKTCQKCGFLLDDTYCPTCDAIKTFKGE